MSEDIEKAAIAMRKAYADYTHQQIVPWDKADPKKKDEWRMIARAAQRVFAK